MNTTLQQRVDKILPLYVAEWEKTKEQGGGVGAGVLENLIKQNYPNLSGSEVVELQCAVEDDFLGF